MENLKKIALINSVLIVFVFLTGFIPMKPDVKKNKGKSTAGKSFAVLELFTSEGCNSCPPAEELLERINKESNGKPVYVLSYHVDYFDNLGWKDVFGSPANTKRQQQYSNWLNAQVYTPQMIVNGKQEFVGSFEKDIRNDLTKQLLVEHTADLSLSAERTGNLVKVNYQAKDSQANDDLFVALVQKNGRTAVQRGENAGRTLSHIQMVRTVSTASLKNEKAGTVELHLPKTAETEQWEVIGLVQNRKSGAISAASSTKLVQ